MIKKLKLVFQTYAVEIGTSVYLLYLLFTTVAPYIYGYVAVWYALDYSYGFGSRLMIGSILHVFTGEFISVTQAYYFVVAALVLLCLLLAVFVGMIYRKASDGPVKNAVLFLIVCYLASPASPAYLWTDENMGRLDTYLFINTLVLAFVYFKVKNISAKYILFLVVGIFTISVHQVYFFLFFPSLLIMLIQDMWESGFQKRQLFYSLGTACVLGIVFLYMQFGSGIYYDDPGKLREALQSTTDLYIDNAPLEAEYFWTIRDHFYTNQLPELRTRVRFGIITVAMLTPIWAVYLAVWIHAIRNNKAQKYKYMLMLLTNVAYVPVFVLMTDWGRWFAAFFVVQFLNLMVLCYVNDRGIQEGMAFLGKTVRLYPALFLLIPLYVNSFEKFEGINVLQQVQDFYYAVFSLKEMLIGH